MNNDTKNPLSKYQSSTSHHILYMCKNTASAAALANTLNDERRLQQDYAVMDTYGRRTTPTVVNDAVIIANSTKNSDFLIKKVRWETMQGVQIFDNDMGTSFATEGSVLIHEPFGILFLNHIVEACEVLGINSASAVYVLKTFFVGRTPEGVVEYISNVRPLMFIATDTTATFTESGGVYDIEFVGMLDGASRMPQNSRTPPEINLAPPANNSTKLADYLKAAEDEVNRAIRAKCAVLRASTDQELITPTYSFWLDKAYASYTATDAAWTSKNNGKPTETPYQVANDHIEAMVRDIVMLSPEIKREAEAGTVVYRPMIHTYVETTDDRHVVNVYVVRVETNLAGPVSASGADRGDGSADMNDPSISSRALKYSYTYTGTNTDVLAFDMKMEMGSAFLQAVTAVNNAPLEAGAQFPSTATSPTTSTSTNSKRMVCAIPAIQSRAPTQYSNILYSSATFNTLFARWASLEAINAKVTILGNPELLDTVTTFGHQFEDITVPVGSGRPTQVGPDPSGALPTKSWGKTASYMFIDVKMPENSKQLTSKDDAEFSKPFWYRGAYSILAIENVFEDGTFIQNVDLMSLPLATSLQDQISKQKPVNNKATSEAMRPKCSSNPSAQASGGGKGPSASGPITPAGPVKTGKKTLLSSSAQLSDAEREAVQKTITSAPIQGKATQTGLQGEDRGNHKHSGIDIQSVSKRAPIVAAQDGVVEVRSSSSGYGNYVDVVSHVDGQEIRTRYAHLDSVTVCNGDVVKAGTQIGIEGNSGSNASNGARIPPHLHYEVLVNGKNLNPNALAVNNTYATNSKAMGASIAAQAPTALRVAKGGSATASPAMRARPAGQAFQTVALANNGDQCDTSSLPKDKTTNDAAQQGETGNTKGV